MANQQEIVYPRDLFVEQVQNSIIPSEDRLSISEMKARKESQVIRAGTQGRDLTSNLMVCICSSSNISKAYKQVKNNKGVAGVDNVPVGEFKEWYRKEGDSLIKSLLTGSYIPCAVKQVEIPKPKGGVRKLGIPTVKDRVIQQAIQQILTPIYEREFSEFSYGFRPHRRAQDALLKAKEFVEDDRDVVVDMDLQSFFDEVNHDRLMHRISTKIQDKVLLQLIRKYLQSGVLIGGLISQRHQGTPQGSPLSPLLSNIVLDELDKELENRGHKFVRYADDFSIFVRSQEAGERVKKSIGIYITETLKFKVNEEKSVVCKCNETSLLSYTLGLNGNLLISSDSIKRLKSKVKLITKRNRGVSFDKVISELNPFLQGWFHYFKYAKNKRLFRNLDAWIRRKLRCYRLKQCKKVITVKRFLKSLGVPNYQSWILALSGKGHWRKSGCPQAHQAMNLKWFEKLGLFDLSLNYKMFTI